MKNYTILATSALTVAYIMNLASSKPEYVALIPNGFQEIAHPDQDTAQLSDFATAFSAAGKKWTPEFCKATFPGASMTNGEALGDPCCTWKTGKPDFAVKPFLSGVPTEATKCSADEKQGVDDNSEAEKGGNPGGADAAEKGGKPEEAGAPEKGEPAEDYTETDDTSAEKGGVSPPEAETAPATPGAETPTGEGAPSPPPSGGGCAAKARKLRR